MSVATTIATIKQRMTEFKVALVNALNNSSGVAPHADTADQLGGQTPASVISTLRAEVTKHTEKLRVGIHKVNVETLGTYTKAQFEAKLDLMLDLDSGVPLSFFGDREYLAPDITGSFESGSSASPDSNVAMILEDNGTLMMLRSGTDGDSAGVYYSYLRNSANELDVTNQLVTTNTRYQPAFFGSDKLAYCVYNGTQSCIVGRLKNKATGAYAGFFVSLTNNTFDQTKHTGIVIPEGDIIQPAIEGTATNNIPMAYVKGQYVYILIQKLKAGAPELGFKVYRLPLANVIAGNYAGLEALTGWTINRGGAGTVSKTDLTIFDNVNDPFNFTGNAAAVRQGMSNGNGAMTVNITEDGRAIMTYCPYVQLYGADLAVQDRGLYVDFSFEITDSKVIDVAKYHNTKVRVHYDSTELYFWPAPAMNIEKSGLPLAAGGYYSTFFGQIGGQANIALYTTKYNQMWMFSTTTYYTARQLVRYTFPVATALTDACSGAVRPNKIWAYGFTGRFGSPLSQTFSVHASIGDSLVLCSNINNKLGVIGTYNVLSALEGDGTYQYKSISGQFGFRGFNPTTNRKYVLDMGGNNQTANVTLNEGDASTGTYLSQGRFSSMGLVPFSRAGRINEAMQTSGTIQTTAAVLASLRSQVMSNLNARGYAFNSSPGGQSPCEVELNVPQLYGDMPPFVVASFVRNDKTIWTAIYAVTISGSRQNVTGASIIAGSFAVRQVPEGGTSGIGISGTDQIGQTAIRRVAGGFAVGTADSNIFLLQGDTETALHAWNYNASTGVFASVGAPLWNYYQVAPSGWLNFPNRGLWLSTVSEFLRYTIDAGTKMLGYPMVSTAGFTQGPSDAFANFTNGNACYVVISQKIVSAWTLYFSGVVPTMLDGKYQLVQPLTYDLTPGTDANKTFHIWLVKRNGVNSYLIVDSNNATPVSEASIYIGYATTTAEGIQTIVVEKRTAIGGMVLARASQGSAIPLTSGVPNNPGKLNWS